MQLEGGLAFNPVVGGFLGVSGGFAYRLSHISFF